MTALRVRPLLASVTLAAAAVLLPVATPANATTSHAPAARPHHDRFPRIVNAWATAWNRGDSSALASLFTRDGVYQDLAFQQTWRGHRQIALWHSITHQGIADVRIKVTNAFRSGDDVAVQWTFSGTMRGAPASFTVPATTILRLRHGHIVSDVDYYNRADLLKQSGLPADWTPPTS